MTSGQKRPEPGETSRRSQDAGKLEGHLLLGPQFEGQRGEHQGFPELAQSQGQLGNLLLRKGWQGQGEQFLIEEGRGLGLRWPLGELGLPQEQAAKNLQGLEKDLTY